MELSGDESESWCGCMCVLISVPSVLTLTSLVDMV